MPNLVMIEDVSIVLVAQKQSFSIVSYQALEKLGFISQNDKISEKLVSPEPFLRVKFNSGITISIEPPKVIFIERIGNQKLESLETPKLAIKFLESFKHFNFTALGINPRACMVFENSADACGFVVKLLDSSRLLSYESYFLKDVSANLSFEGDAGKFNLNICAGEKKTDGGGALPVVWFNSNFHFDIEGTTKKDQSKFAIERINNINVIINNLKDLLKSQFK